MYERHAIVTGGLPFAELRLEASSTHVPALLTTLLISRN